jgi:hypothetical protein
MTSVTLDSGSLDSDCALKRTPRSELPPQERLQGKPEPDHRNGFYREIPQPHQEKRMDWEGEYFSLKWFKKGSAHLTFKKPDRVDALNAILAKHFPNALAGPR